MSGHKHQNRTGMVSCCSGLRYINKVARFTLRYLTASRRDRDARHRSRNRLHRVIELPYDVAHLTQPWPNVILFCEEGTLGVVAHLTQPWPNVILFCEEGTLGVLIKPRHTSQKQRPTASRYRVTLRRGSFNSTMAERDLRSARRELIKMTTIKPNSDYQLLNYSEEMLFEVHFSSTQCD
ncbi:hypothetical protein J6590_005901 [Homalodisca vitripennis]|nr:hypothetical protein J6590_005901 [Homalodisca vitripennis]